MSIYEYDEEKHLAQVEKKAEKKAEKKVEKKGRNVWEN